MVLVYSVKARFTPAKMSKQRLTLSKQHSTLSKGRNFTISSFDIVAVFGNKVEHCFDIVAGVDRALPHVSRSSVIKDLCERICSHGLQT